MKNTNTKIPFVDLHSQYRALKKDIDSAIFNVINSSSFIRGPFVDKFEEEFAEKIGVDNCISCANGTDAIYIGLKALDIKPGDEVIVPAHSWISTSETVTQAGAKVVFCDTNNHDFTIDVTQIENKITSKTVGIIPVHLFGHPADMNSILSIAKKNNLWVIEDCAQAHLAQYKGKNIGTFGDISTFSFYPGKNLGAMGDAGAILTNNKKLSDNSAKFARHGGLSKGDHEIEGINSRMDGIQAAILSVKLRHLDAWTLQRQNVASIYKTQLESCKEILLPKTKDTISHVWHLFVIKTEYRDELANFLKKSDIQVGINYPVALPFLPAYERYNHNAKEFPNAFYNQSRILSLPIYPELSEEEIIYICDKIKSFFTKMK
tara:strand:- start:9027 stop:10154 length:1128 start_codon:yes stop_codon:yes gene_type:complete